jgi:hypothetical protein
MHHNYEYKKFINKFKGSGLTYTFNSFILRFFYRFGAKIGIEFIVLEVMFYIFLENISRVYDSGGDLTGSGPTFTRRWRPRRGWRSKRRRETWPAPLTSSSSRCFRR